MSIVTLPISRAYDDALSKALLASLDYVTSDDYYDMGSRSVGVCWMHQVPCVGATAGEDEFVCSRCIGCIGCIGRGGEGVLWSRAWLPSHASLGLGTRVTWSSFSREKAAWQLNLAPAARQRCSRGAASD